MDEKAAKYFIRGLNSDYLTSKLQKHVISTTQFLQYPDKAIRAIIDSGDQTQDEQIVEYVLWFKSKLYKTSSTIKMCQTEQKQLNDLVPGCGKQIPNSITSQRECFTWWFTNGNWQSSKKNQWRVGCNWGGNGTLCGKLYSDGANYCRQCGEKIQKILKSSQPHEVPNNA